MSNFRGCLVSVEPVIDLHELIHRVNPVLLSHNHSHSLTPLRMTYFLQRMGSWGQLPSPIRNKITSTMHANNMIKRRGARINSKKYKNILLLKKRSI